ncbi:MAG: MBL fold metallo-hydrolase [Thermoplasmata archaeon]|nr:MBL fold metallo-hydrolase [Thermoplasmata archaeon]
MPGPSITFLGGVHEIGGNKILVEDGPDRILFDFGPSFSDRWEQFYINFLQPRSVSPVKDLLEFDLLPRLDGLYSADALAGSDLPYKAPEVHGLFVSHAHLDHAGHLDLVDPEIPVYVAPGTKQLLDTIQTAGTQKYGDHDWRVVPDGTRVQIGHLEVEPVPVDHSIPSAYGFLIRTRQGTIAYTGDFRMHGPRAAQTHAFVEQAASEKPVALIMEGTRAGPDPRRNFSEAGVREGVDGLLEKSDRLALVSCYPRDIDRLTTLYHAAREAGREFVVPVKTAHLLTSMAPTLGPQVPTPGRSEGLRVYARSKKKTFKWERPFLDDAVDAAYVGRHGSEILLSLDLPHFAELIDVRPPRGSPFIHSMSEPFSEDDVDDQVLHNWLDHFGLAFHQYHASGHCAGPELAQVARQIGPGTVFPVHTEHPEEFAGYGPSSLPPVKGERYPLRS